MCVWKRAREDADTSRRGKTTGCRTSALASAQWARLPRRASREREADEEKANDNPDTCVQCFYCEKKGHRERDCRKRIREQGSGQEALAEDEAPPGCEAHDGEENNWILMLRLDSWRNDGIEDGSRLLIDSGAGHSECPPQFCAGTTTRPTPVVTPLASGKWSNDQEIPTENSQFSMTWDKHRRHFPGRGRSQTNRCSQRRDSDGLRSRMLFRWSTHSDWWTSLEAGTGSKTWSHDEIAPLELSLIPEAETEAFLSADHD